MKNSWTAIVFFAVNIIPSAHTPSVPIILLTLRLSESRMSLLILPSVSKEKPLGA